MKTLVATLASFLIISPATSLAAAGDLKTVNCALKEVDFNTAPASQQTSTFTYFNDANTGEQLRAKGTLFPEVSAVVYLNGKGHISLHLFEKNDLEFIGSATGKDSVSMEAYPGTRTYTGKHVLVECTK